jgi:hypothetical protein
MDLDMEFYGRVKTINWLSRCGESSAPDLGFEVNWVNDNIVALESLFSTQWASATTMAQGCLTGYLAKNHRDQYGQYWNNLANQSRTLLEAAVGKSLSDSLVLGGWSASLSRVPFSQFTPTIRATIGKQMADLLASQAWDQCLFTKIVLDINRAALEISYRRIFPRAPIFFDRVLRVYEAGRLPCGWDGILDTWPDGKLVAY